MAARPRHPPAGRDPPGVTNDAGDVQDAVVNAVVVEKTIVVVEGLPVVSGEHDNCLFGHSPRFQLVQQPADAGVHVQRWHRRRTPSRNRRR